jgi:hypothetical protein
MKWKAMIFNGQGVSCADDLPRAEQRVVQKSALKLGKLPCSSYLPFRLGALRLKHRSFLSVLACKGPQMINQKAEG